MYSTEAFLFEITATSKVNLSNNLSWPDFHH